MIIAEIAQAHDGSVGILHSYIDALAATGVDAIKFQTHIAEAESSEFETFRVPFSYVDKTRFDYWKRMELTVEQWIGIKDHCHKVGVQFISSPFSCQAVDVLEKAGVDRYKVGSGEVNNHLLLHKIISTGKPAILSSGMSTLEELDVAIKLFTDAKADISLLQCTTAYPTQPAEWGLDIIKTFQTRYNIPVGFSDHSGNIAACMAASALGAQILEFHAVFDKRMFGPDAAASLTIDEISQLVKGVKQILLALQHANSKDQLSESKGELKKMFGKSLCVNKDLPKDYTISFKDLDAKKPAGHGIDPVLFKHIIGKKLNHDLSQWSFLTSDDIQ